MLEALNFCRYVLGVDSIDPSFISRRCRGVGCRKYNGPMRQAEPLRVEDLRALHLCVSHGDDPWNVLAAGAFLFAVYARARWSDLQHASGLTVDKHAGTIVYLEASISEFKTASSAAFRGHHMAAIAPAAGVTEEDWVSKWLEARGCVGIDVGTFPILPAPHNDCTPSVRPVGTSEAGAWLRMLLKEAGCSVEGRRITSHSLKATALSQLAKYGADINDRLVLGGHVGGFKSVLTYSRNVMAAPLRALERMLYDIRCGRFLPDATRSGRFVAPSVSTNSLALEKRAPEGSSSSSEVEDTSSDSSIDSAVSWDRPPLQPPEGYEFFKHYRYKTVHLKVEGAGTVFMCGRPVSESYEQVDNTPGDPPRCRQCWRALRLRT